MTPGISLEELLAWNNEAAAFWNKHLQANPALLDLPCSIGGAANVQEFVRHIWGVELRWSQRIARLPEMTKEEMPVGPLDALFELHSKATQIFRTLLDDPAQNWEEAFTLAYDWLPHRRERPPCARSRATRCCIASATGRNWLRSSARWDSRRDSGETCCSARPCSSYRLIPICHQT